MTGQAASQQKELDKAQSLLKERIKLDKSASLFLQLQSMMVSEIICASLISLIADRPSPPRLQDSPPTFQGWCQAAVELPLEFASLSPPSSPPPPAQDLLELFGAWWA